jgi:hypothetical protein
MIINRNEWYLLINPDKFDKLITALRTALDNEGTLNKEATSYNDIFDAFRLALKFYHYEESVSLPLSFSLLYTSSLNPILILLYISNTMLH